MSPLIGLPTAVCSPVAGALGATGLGPVCSVANGVAGAASSAAGSIVGFGVGSVLDAVSGWVTSGAVWLLSQIGAVLSASTAIDLGAPWFRAHYATMASLAGVVIVPILLLGILQALYRQSASQLLRTVLVNVPLAILLTAVSVTLVQIGLAVTDSLCGAVSGGAGVDTGHFMATVATALTPAAAVGQPSAPTFVLFLGGIAVVVGAVLVWLELLLRSAAVYVAVLFLPLALAGLAWPAIAHWSRRLADTLAALVLSKLVIVAVLSLAVGALAGGTGSTPSGASGPGGGFASVLGGAALLLLAGLAPWSLFRLLPFLEGGAVGHLEGLSQRARRGAATPATGLANMALRAAAPAAMAAGAVGVIGARALESPGSSSPAGSVGAAPLGPRPGGGGSGGDGSSAPPSPSGSPTGDGQEEPAYLPGSSIPMWPTTPGSDVPAHRTEDLAAGHDPHGVEDATPGLAVGSSPGASQEGPTGGLPAGLRPMRPGVTYVGPLPRQTGAVRPDHLGRDHLGLVLIGGDQRRDGGGS
jgi:type IV secretion system protein TrbL